jgi:hypothetical protein
MRIENRNWILLFLGIFIFAGIIIAESNFTGIKYNINNYGWVIRG